MASVDKKIIATAGIVTVSVGSINAIANHKTMPSTKFLLGSGALFLILSVLADSGQEDLAKALSIAVMTTVVLGEGNGVLSWINGKGEVDTQKKKTPNAPPPHNQNSSIAHGAQGAHGDTGDTHPDNLTPFPGL